MDKSSQSEEKYEFRPIFKLFTMESATEAEDMLCAVLIFSFDSECFIEEPCAGKPQARFCGGYHSIETNFNLNME